VSLVFVSFSETLYLPTGFCVPQSSYFVMQDSEYDLSTILSSELRARTIVFERLLNGTTDEENHVIEEIDIVRE